MNSKFKNEDFLYQVNIESDIALCISIINNIHMKHKSIFPTLKSFYKYIEVKVESFEDREKLEEYISSRIKKL